MNAYVSPVASYCFAVDECFEWAIVRKEGRISRYLNLLKLR